MVNPVSTVAMIKLLSTDFDGTLVQHGASPGVSPRLLQWLQDLRGQGVLWAINTGRALFHILDGLEEFSFPIKPDFVLTAEREVYRPSEDGTGWEDFGDWNDRATRAHDELFSRAQPLLEEIDLFIQKETRARTINDRTGLGVIASDEQELEKILLFIEQVRAPVPEFHYQRNSVYLRFCHADYSKGTALGELSRLLELRPEEIFAAGDHYNDIPMLDGVYAKWVACPANSAEPVKTTVLAASGYVASGECSEGVVEALERLFVPR